VALSTPRPARIEAFGLSHRGLVREGNEDALLVAGELGLYAVADGLGGAAAGEVASCLAVDAVRRALEDADLTWPLAMPKRPPPGLPRLVAAVERANGCVHAAARADRRKAGMGSTLTALLVLGEQAAVAHVGDSRIYRLRDGRLTLLTLDHTLVGEAVRDGMLTPEEAARSPHRNIITRAVGTRATIDVDRQLIHVAPGDVFLLSTDGLHGVVGDDDLAAILLAEPDLTRATNAMIEAALDAGAPDNVTVVLVRAA
jgi:protein phosphatase